MNRDTTEPRKTQPRGANAATAQTSLWPELALKSRVREAVQIFARKRGRWLRRHEED